MVVTGCSRHLPQLEVLQSGHDVLDVTILLTYFLPQLKSTWTSGNLSNVSVRSFYLRNYLPAAIFAENRCLAKCTRTSWSVPVIRDRGRWRSCSFPAGHTHEPVSRSRLSPVSSWRWKKKNTGRKWGEILFCHTSYLHVFSNCIHQVLAPLLDMFKHSVLSGRTSTMCCPSDVLIPDPLHPGSSWRQPPSPSRFTATLKAFVA